MTEANPVPTGVGSAQMDTVRRAVGSGSPLSASFAACRPWLAHDGRGRLSKAPEGPIFGPESAVDGHDATPDEPGSGHVGLAPVHYMSSTTQAGQDTDPDGRRRLDEGSDSRHNGPAI